MEKERPNPLKFKPLSEGLGFHPFSDGLPYAPVGKAGPSSNRPAPAPTAPVPANPSFQRGSGATSAGPAAFVPPARPSSPFIQPPISPRISVPIATPMPTRHPVQSPRAPRGPGASPTAPFSGQLTSKPESKGGADLAPDLRAELEASYGFGYMMKRVFAFLIDTAFNIGLCAGTFGFALWKQGIDPWMLVGPGMIFLFVVFLATFNWSIMTAQEMAFGTTLGKRLFGLTLDGSAAAIFLRAFFFLPSFGFCAVGLLWAVFDRRRRCWHDLVVNLQPLEIAQL